MTEVALSAPGLLGRWAVTVSPPRAEPQWHTSARVRSVQYQVRQPKRKCRNVSHEEEHDQHWNVENENAFRYGFHGYLADRATDHHGRTDGRREQANAEIENHDDAEVHGVDAECLYHR